MLTLSTAYSEAYTKRKYYLLVNPFSGRKKANQIAETIIIPTFEAADVDVDVTCNLY